MSVHGIGLGLRWEFADELLERVPREIDFLEIAPENYVRRGGAARRTLDRAIAAYPILTHGLALSLGGADALDERYLADIGAIIREVKSPWHSDHACLTVEGGRVLHDLLPITLTRATAARVADRVKQAQDRLGVPMAVENVSFYAHPGASELSEPAFLSEICERANCGLLFDVNNAVVNAQNFGLDANDWLREGPMQRVVQFHVAGHEWFDFREGELHRVANVAEAAEGDRLVIDTHGAEAQPAVLSLLEAALAVTGPAPIVLERDQNIPSLDALVEEIAAIRVLRDRVARSRARSPADRTVAVNPSSRKKSAVRKK